MNNNSFIIIILPQLSLPSLPPSLPVDDAGEAEDDEAGGGEGETEVVEHHGPGLHQVTNHHWEQFPPQQGGDDKHRTHLHSFIISEEIFTSNLGLALLVSLIRCSVQRNPVAMMEAIPRPNIAVPR